jgi:hypothetical protein
MVTKFEDVSVRALAGKLFSRTQRHICTSQSSAVFPQSVHGSLYMHQIPRCNRSKGKCTSGRVNFAPLAASTAR